MVKRFPWEVYVLAPAGPTTGKTGSRTGSRAFGGVREDNVPRFVELAGRSSGWRMGGMSYAQLRGDCDSYPSQAYKQTA